MNILGAGQCGTLLAAIMARHVSAIDLYERGADPREADGQAGRSINLALAARGIRALQTAGVMPRIEPLLVPMRGRMIHDIDGSTEFQRYGQRDDEQIYSVSRGHLNQVLLNAAEERGNVNIHFQQEALGYDSSRCTAKIRDRNNNKDYDIAAAPLIAADGAGSVVRGSYGGSDLIGASRSLSQHGYKELAIPAGSGGKFQLDPGALHIWPRGGFMLIALPNPGGDFTLTLFLANEGEQSFSTLTDEQSVTTFFESHFADAAALIPDLCNAVINNPLGMLGTVRCRHWHDAGNMLLIGDAAHAVVPFHGQGMNLAFEDCVLFERIFAEVGADWQRVFENFESTQLTNANAIADMALENYVEMRDTVRDPKYALQKELAFELERRLPDRFIPRYSMVMFHADIPYRVAKDRGEIQQRLLEQLTSDAEKIDQIDLDVAVATVVEQLDPVNVRRILLTATSYPRSASDWQGVFIRGMLAGLARSSNTHVAYWGPPGPLPDDVEYLGSESDRLYLEQIAERGGFAHLLRANPLTGVPRGLGLIRRLRRALHQNQDSTDIYHLNWLQSALAIPGNGKRVLVTVLGTDYKLLGIPGVAALLRRRFAGNRIVLAPNAEWMVPRLETAFGDQVERVQYVPLGIDSQFYALEHAPEQMTNRWISVLRLTRSKLGPLLEWTKELADENNEFHLIGPMQEEMTLPPWIHYHGSVAPDTLIRDWYPRATAMVTLSQHDEGRPQVLLEAMAAGLPVIASRIPAHADLLDSTGGGLMVESQAEFGAALQAVSNPDTRTTLSAAARQTIRATYGTWDDCANRYHALYSQLLRDSET